MRTELTRQSDWVQKFNTYRANNTWQQAVDLIWKEFNVPGNLFGEILPTIDALIFNLITVTPGRAKIAIELPRFISWNDAPIYDTSNNWWNNITPWTCADWKQYHQALETHFKSTQKANALWESAWGHPDNECLFAYSFGCPDTSYCRYDCDFVEYFASKQIEIGNTLSNTTCDLSNVVLDIVNTAGNIVSTAENITEAAASTANTLGKIAPLAIGAGILYKGFEYLQNN